MNTSLSSKWMWLGLILAAVIVVAGIYYYATSPAEEQAGPIVPQRAPEEISNLETELQAISVEGLDTELNDVERELAQ